MQTYQFNGHAIQVELRAFRTFCWLCAGLVVQADDRTFWPKPDRGPSFSTATEFELMVDGERLSGVARTLHPLWLLPRVKCSVVVAGVEVGQGIQPLRHWMACYIAWTVVMFGVLFALLGIVAFAYAVLGATHHLHAPHYRVR